MEHLIDKDALVAEIERRIERCAKQREDMLSVQCHTLADDASARMGELRCFQDFISTLEVKEVDLDKEFFDWYHKEKNRDYNASILYERYGIISKKLAKHFFELGMSVNNKTQKGEEV